MTGLASHHCRSPWVRSASLVLGALLASACGPKTMSDADVNASGNEATSEASATVAADEGTPSDDQSQEDGWRTRAETDPMTDAEVFVAFGQAVGQNHDIEVTVRCTPSDDGDVSYEIAGFDKNKKGAALETRFGNGGSYNVVQYRVDAKPMKVSRTNDPRYSNKATVAEPHLIKPDSLPIAQANILTLKVPFLDGDEVYRIDQRSTEFRGMVRPCTTARAEAVRKANEWLERPEALPDRRTSEGPMPPMSSPTQDPQPDTPANSAGAATDGGA